MAIGLALLAPLDAAAQEGAPAIQAGVPTTQADADSFVPALRIGLGQDSNVFATASDEQADSFLAITPSFRWSHASAAGDWTVRGSLTDTRYRHLDGEDSLDYRFDASGNFALSKTSKLFGGLGIGRSHEDRTSPDDVFGIEPTRFAEGDAHLGFAHRGPAWTLRIGGTLRRLRFDNVLDAAGEEINNEDRDRDVVGLGVRVGHAWTPRVDVFVQATLDRRSYRWRVDDAGFARDSDGIGWAVGLASRGAGRLQGEVYLGRIAQRFEDPRLEDVGAPVVGASMQWRRGATSASASLERIVADTTVTGASAYLDTSLVLGVDRQLGPRLRARAGVTFARSDFQGIDRRDDVINPSIGASWRLGRRLWLDADYRLLQRRSDLADAAYDRNAFWLGLHLDGGSPTTLPASGDDTRERDPRSTPFASGFYLGAQGGRDVLGTQVSGLRGEHGDYLADFSGDGANMGAFLGYGWFFGRWYAALELDGTRSRADWSHDKSPDSRNFAAAARHDTGLALQLGAGLPGGGLATVGVGRRRMSFESRYVTDEGVESMHVDATVAGTTSFGLEAPLSGAMSVRARYEVARYPRYEVDYDTSAADGFASHVGRFQLGIVWRPGASAAPAGIRPRSGMYAGLHAGDLRLASPMDAVMRQGEDPTQTDFQADFGGRGNTFGAFAGLGHAWGSLYLGAELEADADSASWQHAKQPGGRQFGVESHGSRAAGVRLGVATRGGALLYLRAGPAKARFTTRYVKGGNPDAWIERDDSLSGRRIGVGLETPLSARCFLRLDYSVTRFDAIRFTTTHENADDVAFDTSTQVARVGIGVHF